MAESELFEKGLQARRDVLGAEYVDANLADTDEFMMAFQRVVTEWAWGYAWSRPGEPRLMMALWVRLRTTRSRIPPRTNRAVFSCWSNVSTPLPSGAFSVLESARAQDVWKSVGGEGRSPGGCLKSSARPDG